MLGCPVAGQCVRIPDVKGAPLEGAPEYRTWGETNLGGARSGQRVRMLDVKRRRDQPGRGALEGRPGRGALGGAPCGETNLGGAPSGGAPSLAPERPTWEGRPGRGVLGGARSGCVRGDGERSRSVHRDHDLAEVRSALEVTVGVRGLGEREHAIDNRLDPALGDRGVQRLEHRA